MRENIVAAAKSRILVGDGAMGTELMKRGLAPGACPELWNADEPAKVLDVLRSYRAAGADTLITNTFGGNRWKLAAFDLAGRAAELNKAAVAIARKATGANAWVLADMGPTGRFMAPLGTDSRDSFVEVFSQQARALAEAGADAVILETFMALDEILAGVEAAKATGLCVIASMSFNRDASGSFHTMMGNDIASSVRALDEAGADIIAANCGLGAEHYADIAREMAAATSRPVMVQPNAGMPTLVGAKTIFPMTAEEFAGHVPAIITAGARIVGGCCGTTPDHVRAIRRVVDTL
jgi:5-methyltetrahydrofolate--homocysteine methyltransferase